jgi:hypothetical protein
MKKFIIATALVFTTGIVLSYSKTNDIKPLPATQPSSFLTLKTDLASGD